MMVIIDWELEAMPREHSTAMLKKGMNWKQLKCTGWPLEISL